MGARNPAHLRLRTLLFVPGDRPDRIPKAAAAGADGIAIDLEDAVALSRKDAARRSVTEVLGALPPSGRVVTVRINAVDSGLAEADVDALEPVLDRVHLVIVPMSSSPDAVRAAAALLGKAERRAGLEPGRTGIIPLVETAAGIAEARDIAAADERVHTLAFGPADLSRELGVTPTADGEELFVARCQLVLAAAAAAKPQPIDGPHLDLDDADGLARSAAKARRLGFGGKQVLHPRQIPVVASAFAPATGELRWARRVDEAFRAAEAAGVSSIRLDDGTFVDYPIAHRARALLAEDDPQHGHEQSPRKPPA
ncbi:HpcH/HpaI aldolase/citrate lyase family protein [Pseudonocardia cypriaca]|uniref:Citrate lyase subunit beta/citryl-CoA lyase n=1 Tax=Pseudonocardia cypriaca TaxID=882449 RepID=A0A543FSD5_9PSEU|nr:CoA ester lyase [Pseudonocardia cypriaca]TQM36750.1 citrate lyase subunit beta/citryl-CoA lyase [Pseudonocardia cypriaca]